MFTLAGVGISIIVLLLACLLQTGVLGACREGGMTAKLVQDLPLGSRRRLIFWAALRSVLIAAVLVVLYYVLPLDRPWDAEHGDTAADWPAGLRRRCAGGVRFIVVAVPGVRAVEALALILPFFLPLFASTYFVMERDSAASFTEPLTRTDALYFTVTVFSTVGFGDITAKSEAARVVLIVQMLADLVFLGAVLRVFLGAVQRGRQRRSQTSDDDSQAARLMPASELPGAVWDDRAYQRTRRCLCRTGKTSRAASARS